MGAPVSTSPVANRESAAAQTSVDFGLVIRTPMIEITTMGGGGSTARGTERYLTNRTESAGSDPGPVCYGLETGPL